MRKQSADFWGGFFAFLGVLAILRLLTTGHVEVWMIGVGVACLVYYFRRFPSAPPSNSHAQKADEWLPPAAKLPTPQQVAKQALQRANNVPTNSDTQLTDIGLLAYDGGNEPKVIYSEAIPAYATQLRPFIVINWSRSKTARVTVKFELLDNNEKVRFAATQRYQVQRGKNFLTPHNWLPMGDNELGGDWSLRISIGNQLLAIHEFMITPDAGASFRSYIRADGEIDEWLSKSAAKSITEQMSLEELLEDQDEIDIDMFRESQASRQRKERR